MKMTIDQNIVNNDKINSAVGVDGLTILTELLESLAAEIVQP